MSKPEKFVVLPKVIALGFQNAFSKNNSKYCGYSYVNRRVADEAYDITLRFKNEQEILYEEWCNDKFKFENYSEDDIVYDYIEVETEILFDKSETEAIFEKFKDSGYTSLEIIAEADEDDVLDYTDAEEYGFCDFVNKYYEYSLDDGDYVFCLFRK